MTDSTTENRAASAAGSPPLRALDHCVLPVADLDVARARYEALGFIVAPTGIHPFGTANACIYLANGTFLEPLAVADDGIAQAAARAGNVFVARDRLFRDEAGMEGFSALVFGSENARGDHERFVAAGISAGPLLDFERRFTTPDGDEDIAAFRLAFAAVADDPHYYFTVERVHTPAVDRSALLRHANGASALVRVGVAVRAPAQTLATLRQMIWQEDTAQSGRIATANAQVEIEDAALASIGGRLVFTVAEPDRTADLLARNGVDWTREGDAITVPPAPGQGAAVTFVAEG